MSMVPTIDETNFEVTWHIQISQEPQSNSVNALKEIFDNHLPQITHKSLEECRKNISQLKNEAENEARSKNKGLFKFYYVWKTGKPFNALLKRIKDEQAFRNKKLIDECSKLIFDPSKTNVQSIVDQVCETENERAFKILTNKMGSPISTLFQTAISKNQQFLAKVADPNQVDERGRPLIQMAIEKNNKELVKLLLDKGADSNQRVTVKTPSQPQTHQTQSQFYNWSELRSDSGIRTKSLLQIAIEAGNAEIVRELLEHEADPNAYGSVETDGKLMSSKSMLTIAQDLPASEEILKLLTRHGALATTQDIRGGVIVQKRQTKKL